MLKFVDCFELGSVVLTQCNILDLCCEIWG